MYAIIFIFLPMINLFMNWTLEIELKKERNRKA